MSWFQSTNFASLAKTALKEAQKTIDKALEINEEGSTAGGGQPSATSQSVAAVTEAASDFFSSWGVGPKKSSKKDDESVPTETETVQSQPISTSELSSENQVLEEDEEQEPSTTIKSTSNSKAKRKNSSKKAKKSEKSASLTSDIEVTLIAPITNPCAADVGRSSSCSPPNPNLSDNSSSHHHTRSLSDTVFNSPNFHDDFDGTVQLLDAETIPIQPTILVPTKIFPLDTLTSNPSQTLDLVEIPGSLLTHSSYPEEENKLLQASGATATNLDLLSTIDLGVIPLGNSEDDLTSIIQPQEEEEQQQILQNSVDLLEDSVNSTAGVVADSFCDNTWSWAEASQEEESSLTTKDKEIEESLPTLEPLNIPQEAEKEELCKNEETAAEDSGLGASWDTVPTQLTVVTDLSEINNEDETEVTTSTIEVKSTLGDLIEEVNWSLKEDDEEGSSPPPPFIDSAPPSSAASPINHLESQRESPCPQFEPLSSNNSNRNNKSGGGSEDCTIQDMNLGSQLPESSRSSSIVVVSGRNSTPSRGSGESTGSSASEGHQDIEDHSNASSTSPYERVHIPSSSHHHLLNGKLNNSEVDFVKVKPKSSSASSSDIEVIPSDFSPGGDRRGVSQQTSPVPTMTFQDVECQTDLIVEEITTANKSSKNIEVNSELIREKDEMIAELREEGEKLSKKQFEMSQTVKKLRGKEKENETTIKLLKGELAGKSLENERLMKSYVTKEGVQQAQNETISKLTLEKRKVELKIEQMKSELEDANENCASMKASLEEASVEMLELKNAISSFQRDSAEVDSLTREKSELLGRNELLQKEVDHLRLTINTSQSKGLQREKELETQISTLREKVHRLESELDLQMELVADATMPLSLQIEKLQVELQTSAQQHEKRESILQSSVRDLEIKLKTGLERESRYKELNQSVQSNLSNLEAKVEELERENGRIASDLKSREELDQKELEESRVKIRKLEGQVNRLTQEVERLAKENDSLALELKSEKSFVEMERKKSQSLMDQLSSSAVNRNQIGRNSNSMSTSTTMNNANLPKSGENSPSSHSIMSEASYLDEVFDQNGQNGLNGLNNRSMTPKSFFESFSSLGLIENLQSQLRQRETEVCQFQEEVNKNERIRRTLNEEIAKLTMQNQELQMQMETLAEFQQRLEEMEKNNNALLQMYGEKVEEADELRLDLQDVKDMYKTQIEQLLKK